MVYEFVSRVYSRSLFSNAGSNAGPHHRGACKQHRCDMEDNVFCLFWTTSVPTQARHMLAASSKHNLAKVKPSLSHTCRHGRCLLLIACQVVQNSSSFRTSVFRVSKNPELQPQHLNCAKFGSLQLCVSLRLHHAVPYVWPLQCLLVRCLEWYFGQTPRY